MPNSQFSLVCFLAALGLAIAAVTAAAQDSRRATLNWSGAKGNRYVYYNRNPYGVNRSVTYPNSYPGSSGSIGSPNSTNSPSSSPTPRPSSSGSSSTFRGGGPGSGK